MRLVVQRVREARVSHESRVTGRIGRGLVVLLGVGRTDTEESANYLVEKLLGLRIFPDAERAMNRSIAEEGGEILLVSQFTLFGDCRRGRRPSFDEAAHAPEAERLYRLFADCLRSAGFPPQEGVFGATMEVSLVNDGPVTILLDSDGKF